MKWNALVPELLVADFQKSIWFYVSVLGFSVEYERTSPSFAYLAFEKSQVMIEELQEDSWVTGAMAHPFGRGINLQIECSDVVEIRKRIPVGAGLGGGSSDAAAALRLANEVLPAPLAIERLHEIAAGIGADVPFFLTEGPQLGTGDGSQLEAVDLTADYRVLLVLPAEVKKSSTAAVYEAFDGADGFAVRQTALREALASGDLAALPANDLASSPIADELRELGAFRADVTGAGPAVYGLFSGRKEAEAASRALSPRGRTWLTGPAWYG